MERNSTNCLWGDCPGLDHAPKSREHEGRFTQRSVTAGQLLKSNAPAPSNNDIGSNRAI